MDARTSAIFPFLTRNTLFGNLVKKYQIVSLSWNLVPRLTQYAEFNGGVHFIRYRLEIPFCTNLFQKNQNCQFTLKFGIYSNSNMQNSVVVFTFSVLDQKYHFGATLVQKIKIVSLSWNLILRLIWICGIQWWCSLFLLYTGKTHFGKRR